MKTNDGRSRSGIGRGQKNEEDGEGSVYPPWEYLAQKAKREQAQRRNYGSLSRHENSVRELGGKARGIHTVDSGR